jgi:hypothetical protein
MTKDADNQVRGTTHEGEATEPGKTYNPMEDNSCDPSSKAADPQSIPIGRPISSSDYARLKERAQRGSLPPGENAQEDPREDKAADRGENNG